MTCLPRTALPLVACLIWLAPSCLARAIEDDEKPVEKRYWGVLSAYLENDNFLFSDDNYTSGVGFSWASDDAATYKHKNWVPTIIRGMSFLPTVGEQPYRNFISLTLGHEIYSPDDIESPIPPPDEQPYAGVIFVDSTIYSHGPRSLHGYTLRLGCVGPCSGAERLQKWLHDLSGDPIPKGWDTQLSNEFLINFDYQYHRRIYRHAEPHRFNYDFAMKTGGGFGNYYIGADVGAVARVGYRMPDNYGDANLRAGGTAMVIAPAPPPTRGWRAYAFLGASGFVVGRFLPTDGNTFKNSPRVERSNFMGNLSSGLVVSYGRFIGTWTVNNIAGLTRVSDSRSRDYATLTVSYYIGRKVQPKPDD